MHTRYPENNTVHALYFEAKPRPRRSAHRARRRTAGRSRASAMECRSRRSRRPVPSAEPIRHERAAAHPALPRRAQAAELNRADYIVSANVGRTVQACRQAVMDARRAIGWLASQGYDRIGILGTSLGSCLSLLTAAHEPRVRAQALNHISPYFADVVWRGCRRRTCEQALEGAVDLERLETDVAADQPAGLPRSRSKTRRRCWSMRSTT